MIASRLQHHTGCAEARTQWGVNGVYVYVSSTPHRYARQGRSGSSLHLRASRARAAGERERRSVHGGCRVAAAQRQTSSDHPAPHTAHTARGGRGTPDSRSAEWARGAGRSAVRSSVVVSCRVVCCAALGSRLRARCRVAGPGRWTARLGARRPGRCTNRSPDQRCKLCRLLVPLRCEPRAPSNRTTNEQP